MINRYISKTIIVIMFVSSVLILNPINTYAVSDRQIIVANENTIYADSYQWQIKDNSWMCATPDFHQAYYNSWICTNGKWYYVNKYGQMVTGLWVNNYYVNDNGQWIPNAKRSEGSHDIMGLN